MTSVFPVLSLKQVTWLHHSAATHRRLLFLISISLCRFYIVLCRYIRMTQVQKSTESNIMVTVISRGDTKI